MEKKSKLDKPKQIWETVILKNGEGEKILFRIGLMTFKVSSFQTNNNFLICETALPPGANVEPHSHPEAETFYILEGEFTFSIEGLSEPKKCKKGAFVSVPPYVIHSFKNSGRRKGKILGTMTPGGDEGLESLFRNFGVKVADDYIIPDLNKTIEHLIQEIDKLRNK